MGWRHALVWGHGRVGGCGVWLECRCASAVLHVLRDLLEELVIGERVAPQPLKDNAVVARLAHRQHEPAADEVAVLYRHADHLAAACLGDRLDVRQLERRARVLREKSRGHGNGRTGRRAGRR